TLRCTTFRWRRQWPASGPELPIGAWPAAGQAPVHRVRTLAHGVSVESSLDRDEFVALVGASLRLLEDGADSADVHLVIDHTRLERRPLLREQRVRLPRGRHRVEEADDLEVVLGVALEELLQPGLA